MGKSKVKTILEMIVIVCSQEGGKPVAYALQAKGLLFHITGVRFAVSFITWFRIVQFKFG